MTKPVIHYFPVRGRAEAMRIALSLKGVEYEEKLVDYQSMKADAEHYPFGQCPRFVDGDIDMVQSNAILRFIATKYKLWGSSDKQNATIDMIMEGVESVRNKYVELIYGAQLAEEAKTKWWSAHCDKDTTSVRNNGAHVEYLARYLRSSSTGWVAGTEHPSVADCALWDMTDLLFRVWATELSALYPELKAFHTKFAEQAGVKAYLSGALRHEKVNGNGLG